MKGKREGGRERQREKGKEWGLERERQKTLQLTQAHKSTPTNWIFIV